LDLLHDTRFFNNTCKHFSNCLGEAAVSGRARSIRNPGPTVASKDR
jgi:hypothetical protein